MNDFMDRLWGSIEAGLTALANFLDIALAPLEILGPGGVIFILALGVVLFTRFAGRHYTTSRLTHLKAEFEHWHGVRQEAAAYRDREKGKAMAKNIDQAKLNQVYYDYFFEGLLKSLVTRVLPVLLVLAYLSRTYTSENLADRFGSPWIFSLDVGASAFNIGTLFWYILCLVMGFLLVHAGSSVLKRGGSH